MKMGFESHLDTAKQWLMRTNAKQVLACAIIILLLVTGWWTWWLLRVRDFSTPSATGNIKQKIHANLGLMSILTMETTHDLELNPFAGAPEKPEPNKFNPPPGTSNTTFTIKKTLEPVKKPDTASLTYKGIFVKSDGTQMALIEDSKSGKSSFYTEGDTLLLLKVLGVDDSSVEVLTVDGARIKLELKKPQVFLEGRSAK